MNLRAIDARKMRQITEALCSVKIDACNPTGHVLWGTVQIGASNIFLRVDVSGAVFLYDQRQGSPNHRFPINSDTATHLNPIGRSGTALVVAFVQQAILHTDLNPEKALESTPTASEKPLRRAPLTLDTIKQILTLCGMDLSPHDIGKQLQILRREHPDTPRIHRVILGGQNNAGPEALYRKAEGTEIDPFRLEMLQERDKRGFPDTALLASLRTRLNGGGFTPPTTRRSNPGEKMPAEDIRLVLRLVGEGHSVSEVERMTRITHSTVRKIIEGQQVRGKGRPFEPYPLEYDEDRRQMLRDRDQAGIPDDERTAVCRARLAPVVPPSVTTSALEAKVISILRELGEPVSPSDLAALTDIKLNSISSVLRRLLRKGLVQRQVAGKYQVQLPAPPA